MGDIPPPLPEVGPTAPCGPPQRIAERRDYRYKACTPTFRLFTSSRHLICRNRQPAAGGRAKPNDNNPLGSGPKKAAKWPSILEHGWGFLAASTCYSRAKEELWRNLVTKEGPELFHHGKTGDGGEHEGISVSKEKFGEVQGQNSHPSTKGHQWGYCTDEATSFYPLARRH